MQDPPEVLPEMVAKWLEGYEMVFGVRRSRDNDSLHQAPDGRPLRSSAQCRLARTRFRRMPAISGCSTARSSRSIRKLPERNRFMKGLFAWAGFKQAAVEYDRVEREDRQEQVQLLEAVDARARRHHVAPRPCRFASGPTSALWSRCSLSPMLGFIAVRHADLRQPGCRATPRSWSRCYSSAEFSFISLGVLGEYVGRILTETKQRPLYVVRDAIGMDGAAAH